MRPNADAWPNLSVTQEIEPHGCEWRTDGIVARSWPVATIQHCNNTKRMYLESQLMSLALWLVDEAKGPATSCNLQIRTVRFNLTPFGLPIEKHGIEIDNKHARKPEGRTCSSISRPSNVPAWAP